MIEHAPGGPGIPPTWTSSAKDMVGCALGNSRLWFTLGFGIVNEVYYPRVDLPQIRDLGFIVADGEGFWAEVKRVANYCVQLLAPGVPAVEILHQHERYTLRLRIAPDSRRDVLAIECRLDSDGWQDFARNGAMTWEYANAGPGNVSLMAELPRRAVLALGFGSSDDAAATLAITSLLQNFDSVLQEHVALWQTWHAEASERHAVPLDIPPALADQHLVSTVVLRSHRDKTYPGAMVASLSVPWGDTGDERGGYHLVWPRDLVETAGALLSLGAEREARDTLRYLIATQIEDGHWYQNQWLGGRPYWQGIQLDESAFPVLLAVALDERDALSGIAVEDMVRRALGFIARSGPATEQDRWEENAGVNPFTLAICIAALVAGAELLPAAAGEWAIELADFWNSNIENWTSVSGTPLAEQLQVSGYYVRVAP